MTYLHNGRQYIVVAVSQNGKPAELIALTLDGVSENGQPPAGGVPLPPAPPSAEAAAAAITATPAELTQGLAAYDRSCAVYHGPAGRGGIGPLLTGRNDLANVVRVTTQGQGEMPPFGATLPAADIDAVSKYIVKALGAPSAGRGGGGRGGGGGGGRGGGAPPPEED